MRNLKFFASVVTMLAVFLPSAPVLAQSPIQSIIHSARKPLSAGDVIHVIMNGSSRGTADVEIMGTRLRESMIETSRGRYEADIRVPRGLNLKDGILMVTLRAGGRQTIREADQTVTIRAGRTAPPPPPRATVVDVTPGDGVLTQNARPWIHMRFASKIDDRSLSFRLDRQDFTAECLNSSAKLDADELLWRPSSDLAPGTHRAEVFAKDRSGETHERAWSFQVPRGRTAPPPPPPSRPSHRLGVSNLSSGQLLGSSFTISGTGVPDTTVTATVEYPKMDILSVLAGRMLRFQERAKVDSTGRYSMNLDARNVRRGQPMKITVADNVSSPVVRLNMERGRDNQTQATPSRPKVTPDRWHVDNQNKFKLVIPSGWKIDNSQAPSNVVLQMARMPEQDASLFVAVTQPRSLQDIFNDASRNARNNGDKVGAEVDANIKGVPAKFAEVDFKGPTEGAFLVAVTQSFAYVFIFVVDDNVDSAVETHVTKIVESLELFK